MAHELDDSEWEEVEDINGYALFMGYLSMAVKGMGVLVVLWTTVVLLGGFVSMLHKKDFWSLTIITLVQTAGVFDVLLNEKLRYVQKSFFGFLGTIFFTVYREDPTDGGWRAPLLYFLLFIQLLVLIVILFPLAVLYLFGLLITTGLSLWRLIERDYGNGDGGANLQPALKVLYSLALFQGVLFCYRSVSYIAGKRLAHVVAKNYGFDANEGRTSVVEYMRQTKIGCEKDPSFTKGRNLVTYAVTLMKSESSSGDYVSGARILDRFVANGELRDHHALIRQLVGSSSSSSQVMQRLLQSLRSTSPLDREVREFAARIVSHLASEINLTTFPHGIRCISSLLETTTSEQQDDDSSPSGHYKELMVHGLVILDKLAAEEHNRRVISSTQGLLSKAMAPVSADLLHRIDHGAWFEIVAASLQLMCRLVTAPGDTGAKLRSQIFKNNDAINTTEKIANCEECSEQQRILAIKILTKLPMETEAPSTDSREKITKLLVAIFLDKKKPEPMRELAGEALAMLSDRSETNATIIFKASDTIVHDLTTMLFSGIREYRISAAKILEHLYVCYTIDDDYLKKLTDTMIDLLPKLLTEILLVKWTTQKEKPAEKTEKGTDRLKFSTPNNDIEGQQDGVASEGNGDINEQNEGINEDVDRKLHAALLSLSAAIFGKSISDDKDFTQLAEKIAQGDPAFSFTSKLKELVKGNSKATANCLRILKITSRMIITLIRLDGVYVEAELESLLDSLSSASKKMMELEGFMMFSSSDPSAIKPVNSLVKEAQDLLKEKKEKQAKNLAATPVTSVNENQLIDSHELLVAIFLDKKKPEPMRQLAGEALAMLSDRSETNATIIFKASDTIVHDLTTMLFSGIREYRISAAKILEHLYVCYTIDDDYLKKLTGAMIDVLPKLLTEILLVKWTMQKEKPAEKAEKGTDRVKFSAPNNDIDKMVLLLKQNEGINEDVDRKLHAALLSLSAAIFGKSISDDKDFTQLADKIAQGDSAFSFTSKLKELTMELEGFMMFSSSDPSAIKPVTSLVKEAQDLLKEKKEKQAKNLAVTSVNENQLIE
uniref:Uncharacterized protein n=1 Tax=Leersia perrieri TaxID=77586 RepID=A0A0D9Y047_9ORYZ